MTRADRDKLRRLVVEGQHLAPSLVLELLDQVDKLEGERDMARNDLFDEQMRCGYQTGIAEGLRLRIDVLEQRLPATGEASR